MRQTFTDGAIQWSGSVTLAPATVVRRFARATGGTGGERRAVEVEEFEGCRVVGLVDVLLPRLPRRIVPMWLSLTVGAPVKETATGD